MMKINHLLTHGKTGSGLYQALKGRWLSSKRGATNGTLSTYGRAPTLETTGRTGTMDSYGRAPTMETTE